MEYLEAFGIVIGIIIGAFAGHFLAEAIKKVWSNR